MFKGEILVQKMQVILDNFGYSLSQINQNTFSSIFYLNVKSNSSMVGASGAIIGILVAFGMMNPNA